MFNISGGEGAGEGCYEAQSLAHSNVLSPEAQSLAHSNVLSPEAQSLAHSGLVFYCCHQSLCSISYSPCQSLYLCKHKS